MQREGGGEEGALVGLKACSASGNCLIFRTGGFLKVPLVCRGSWVANVKRIRVLSADPVQSNP